MDVTGKNNCPLHRRAHMGRMTFDRIVDIFSNTLKIKERHRDCAALLKK
jgi:hypothetical protein